MGPLLEDLHDATLVHVNFTWETGVVDFHLRTYLNPSFLLRITKVTSFHATRDFEWGPSSQVNTVITSEKTVVIEMQSGDIIRIIGHVVVLPEQ
ncbi:hypothetical protein GCM10011383_09520 [Hymenobacter cavernae]|uniref:Galectin n=1 Tax=Hymenobacter cavernae TaxID=2044852 RepID=A0ABQ1TPQ1_9BACT|nr:hypothetical protein GCM10011383_09520 [Hymenobacter cavernae]